jgi:hypothetical protein
MGMRAADLNIGIRAGWFAGHFKRAETNTGQASITLLSDFEGHEFPFCILVFECLNHTLIWNAEKRNEKWRIISSNFFKR